MFDFDFVDLAKINKKTNIEIRSLLWILAISLEGYLDCKFKF